MKEADGAFLRVMLPGSRAGVFLFQCSAGCNWSEASAPGPGRSRTAAWKISVRRRKEGSVSGAVCSVLVFSYLPPWCARAAGGAVCVLWVWCHQHKGDICPLVTLSTCPDGAKSSLSLCQLRHGTGMPTWRLTLKSDMRGVCRQEIATCGSHFRDWRTFTLPGRL